MKIEDLKKIAGMIPDDLRESFEEMIKKPASEEEIALFKKMQAIEARKAEIPEPEFTKAKRAEPVNKEENPNESELEKAAKRYATEGDEISGLYIIEPEADAFKAGAKWQKQQIMAKAITARCFGFQGDALFSFRLPAKDYLVGSEVKAIVIKED